MKYSQTWIIKMLLKPSINRSWWMKTEILTKKNDYLYQQVQQRKFKIKNKLIF